MEYYAIFSYPEWVMQQATQTREEAIEFVRAYEEQDMDEGTYRPGAYIIKRMQK